MAAQAVGSARQKTLLQAEIRLMRAEQRLGSALGEAGGSARSPAVRGAAAGRRRRPIPAVRARNRTPFGLGASGGDDELI